jgi:type II secretory pathway component PulJ
MSHRGRPEAGFTLVEVLLAMTLSLAVLTATLSVFSTMERNTSANQKVNDAQQHARVGVDALARRLRNLASPADPDPTVTGYLPPQPLERAEAQDLVFRTVNSEGGATDSNRQNLERYRYCLDTATKRLYLERQTWTGVAPAMPTATTCGPGDGWPDASRRIAAESVVNGTRPVFKYQVSPTPGTYGERTSIDQSNFPSGIAIRSQLWIDPDTTRPPAATTLNTRVFLRNQNRPPVGVFTVTPTGGFQVVLNASDSVDPEGNPLSYQWLDNGAVVYPDPADPKKYTKRSTYTLTVDKPSGTTVATHVFTLKVLDAGGLSPTTAPAAQTVTCKQTGCAKAP